LFDNALIAILIGSVVTWRITLLITEEDGPFDIFANFRDLIGIKYDEFSNSYGTNVLSKLFSCYKCTSVWIGWLVAVLIYGIIWQILIFGLFFSGMTLIIQEKLK
jgi:hypothetical protein